MIRPHELQLDLPMEVGNSEISTTQKVWAILSASYKGDLTQVKELAASCAGLIYAQYNYAPPIHFAVREGHAELVDYLLDNGAHDPAYRFYPFQESLEMVAEERGFPEIVAALKQYAAMPDRRQFSGDNGHIFYERMPLQTEFETAVSQNNLVRTAQILQENPGFALDPTYFWSEGILTMPAKKNHREMIDLLMSYGAQVPDILKWTPRYHFERYDGAEYLLEKGMNPNTMSWQRVTILHNMAREGQLDKARLLIQYGADLDPIDEAYQSTPLGLAARFGQFEMVEYLLQQGADPQKSGAPRSTPLAWARLKGHRQIADLLSAYQ